MSIRIGLARLAGARPSLLRKTPGDLTKQAAMGGVLLTTAGVAAISAFFAMSSALSAVWWVAILIGLGWGVVILNLDRMLIISMNGLHTFRLKLLAAIPRVLLALVIGTVVSTPLVLRIFQPEIEARLPQVQSRDIEAVQGDLRGANDRIGQLSAQQTQLQAAIDGKSAPAVSNDPDVQAATKVYQAADSTYQQLDQAAQCELDGTCGSGHPGNGESYQSKKSAADDALQARNQAKSQLDQATAAAAKRLQGAATQAAAQARQQLPVVQAELAQQEKSRDSLAKESFQNASGDTGLLARLQALELLTKEDSTAWWTHAMLFLLFVCIELLPVLTKVITSFGLRTPYDALVEREDDSTVRLDGLRADAERDIARQNAEARVAIAQQQLDKQVEAGKLAAERVAEEQSKITMRAIEVWAGLAQLRADEEIQRWYEANVGHLAPPAQATPVPTHGIAWPATPAPPGSPGSAVPPFTSPHTVPLNVPSGPRHNNGRYSWPVNGHHN
jgi:hypothetical protein